MNKEPKRNQVTIYDNEIVDGVIRQTSKIVYMSDSELKRHREAQAAKAKEPGCLPLVPYVSM